jgi:hypothetical protein
VGGRVGIGNVGTRGIGRMWRVCLRFEVYVVGGAEGSGYAGEACKLVVCWGLLADGACWSSWMKSKPS